MNVLLAKQLYIMAEKASTPQRFLDSSVIEKHCRTCWIDIGAGQRYKIFSVDAFQYYVCLYKCGGLYQPLFLYTCMVYL